jgi:tetratricopeptide (TPR) repeat protein
MRIVLHDRVIDLNTGQVRGGTALTQFECSILRYLRERNGKTISRDRLLVDVWGYPKPVPTRSVDTAIRRIRQKIEADRKHPLHLLTVKGEGYRWWDAGAVPVADDERCLGRPQWTEQLVWAEETFGRQLQPHDSEVGLADSIRSAFQEETAELSHGERATLDLLSLAQRGWTPTELARHTSPMAIRTLVQGGWVVTEGARVRLHELWWPVRSEGRSARIQAAALWKERMEAKQRIDLPDLLQVFGWPELSAGAAGELLALAVEPLDTADHRQPFLEACRAVLERAPPPDVLCRLRLARARIRMGVGLMREALDDAEAAAADAPTHAPDAEAWALYYSAQLKWWTGDLQGATLEYPRAIAKARPQDRALCSVIASEYGRVLWANGQRQEGLAAMREAHSMAQQEGAQQALLVTEMALALHLLAQGNHGEAMSRLEHIRASAHPAVPKYACAAALQLANAHIDLQQLEAAEAWLHEVAVHADADQDAVIQAQVQEARGCLAAMQGHWGLAKQHYLASISLMEDAQLRNVSVVARAWLAVAGDRLEDPRLTSTMLKRAHEIRANGSSAPVPTTILALACVALGLPGASIPVDSPPSVQVRIARRTWGLATHSERGS